MRTETEILNHWKNYNETMVSICCTTYNHESYVEYALKGFLMQKTDFPFEVLVHDDASTDKTQNIIKYYAEKYPNIIKPIYQSENKYSQGIRVNYTFNYLRAKGKYIALCEGDDYWTDKNKLQKQVDILEKNDDFMMCLHATAVLIDEDNIVSKKIKLNQGDKIISAPEIIMGGGEYGHTSSFLFRRKMIIDPPKWYTSYPAGDTPTRLLAASKGKIYYIDEEMSVYRKGVKGSWTGRMKDREKYLKHWQKAIEMYDEYNKYTKYRYSKEIRKRKSIIAYQVLQRLEPSSEVVEQYYSLLSGTEKIKYNIKVNYPGIFNILKGLRK